jgi:hypothetical protein
MKVGTPSYDKIQVIKERVADLDNGVKLIDDILGIAAQPGRQLGAVGGVKRGVREIFRIGGDVSSLVPGAEPALKGLADLSNRMLQQDIDASRVDPDVAASILSAGDPAVDAKAMEARLQYLNARMLKGPDQRLNVQDVAAAKESSRLFGMRSEQTVVQNLLVLRNMMTQSRQSLQKSANFKEQPETPKPGLGEHGAVAGQQAAPKELPRVANDADYDKLKSGEHFIDPEGNERIKP